MDDVWREAVAEARADQQAALRRLGELREEMRRIKAEREEAKLDLRDAERALKSAAFALKTGRVPQ